MNQLPLSLPTALAAREALFRSDDGYWVLTTSRGVAERFGKLHRHVTRSIEKLRTELPDAGFWASNFGRSTYRDSRGKPQREYIITHDGFALLVMGFTGREALAWKVAFLCAFRDMESELIAAVRQRDAALDQLRPLWKPTLEGKLSGKSRQAIGAPLGKTPAAITYHTGQLRRFGLLPARGAVLH